jgi:hypothetical protein
MFVSIARIKSADGSIELEYSFDGDYLVSIEVSSFGFTGHIDGHSAKSDFEGFRNDLAALEARRVGEAVLVSAYPGEFSVRIAAIDRVGHMAVTGEIRYATPSNDMRATELKFGFVFDPSQLKGFSDAFAS